MPTDGDATTSPTDDPGTGVDGVDATLLALLACPRCRSALRADAAAQELVCTGPTCGLAYPVRDAIPVMLLDEARDPRGVLAAGQG